MAAISGANPIVASDVNNFTGELFKIAPHRTPLLAAAGEQWRSLINSTFFQFKHRTTLLFLLLHQMTKVVHLTILKKQKHTTERATNFSRAALVSYTTESSFEKLYRSNL